MSTATLTVPTSRSIDQEFADAAIVDPSVNPEANEIEVSIVPGIFPRLTAILHGPDAPFAFEVEVEWELAADGLLYPYTYRGWGVIDGQRQELEVWERWAR